MIPSRTVSRTRRSVTIRTITPVTAISRTIRPDDRTRTIPGLRRTIRIRPPSPITVIVVGAACAPVPSPTAPTPGLIVDQQSPDADSNSKTDKRRPATNIDDGRVIFGHVHDLRRGWLNYIDRLTAGLLHLNLLLLTAAQRAGVVSLIAQTLDRGRNRSLVGVEGRADGGVVVDVLRHHLQHLREVHQGNKRGVEAVLLGCVGQRCSGEPGVVGEPIIDIENFLRIC